jgi:hypothetical protein
LPFADARVDRTLAVAIWLKDHPDSHRLWLQKQSKLSPMTVPTKLNVPQADGNFQLFSV